MPHGRGKTEMAELGFKLRAAMVNTDDCFVPCGSFCVHKVRSV